MVCKTYFFWGGWTVIHAAEARACGAAAARMDVMLPQFRSGGGGSTQEPSSCEGQSCNQLTSGLSLLANHSDGGNIQKTWLLFSHKYQINHVTQ